MPWTNGSDAGIPIEGDTRFHVNLPAFPQEIADFVASRPALEPYVVEPVTLRRVFAGDEADVRTNTVPLVFDTEAQAKEVLSPLGYWLEPDPDADV